LQKDCPLNAKELTIEYELGVFPRWQQISDKLIGLLVDTTRWMWGDQLNALGAGRRPTEVARGQYEIRLTPDLVDAEVRALSVMDVIH